MKRYIRANISESPSAYICRNFPYYNSGMVTYDINGVKITTNLLAYKEGSYSGSCPRGYEGYQAVKNKYSDFDELVAKGYTNIKFISTPSSIRGYHHSYVAYKR